MMEARVVEVRIVEARGANSGGANSGGASTEGGKKNEMMYQLCFCALPQSGDVLFCILKE